MTTKAVLEKLMEVERALQSRDCLTAHLLVFETQERLLELDRAMIETQALKLHPPLAVPSCVGSDWSARAHALRSALNAEEDAPGVHASEFAHLRAF